MNFLYRICIGVSCIFLITGNLYGQRANIDTNILGKWPILGKAELSSYGTYAGFIAKYPYLNNAVLTLKKLSGGWQKSYQNGSDVHFLLSNKYATLLVKDTLHIVCLGHDDQDKTIAIRSFKYPRLASCDEIAYEPKENNGTVILLNAAENKSKEFRSIKNYFWEEHGNALVLIQRDNNNKTIVKWVDLPTLTESIIWSSENVLPNSLSSWTFNKKGDELAFSTTTILNNRPEISLWNYHRGQQAAMMLTDNRSIGMIPGYSIQNNFQISNNGRWLFFQVQKILENKPKQTLGAAQVDIYSYRDMTLQSQQLANKNESTLTMVISTGGGNAISLEREVDGEDRIITNPQEVTGDYIILGEKLHVNFKPWWLVGSHYSYYLVSLRTGKRTLIKEDSKFPFDDFDFSPDDKKVIYWDSIKAAYASYDISSGNTILVTKGIPFLARTGDYIDMFSDSKYPRPFGRASWSDEGRSMIVYNKYDIWKVDPNGKETSINLTKGYGAKHHILLRLVNERDEYYQPIIYNGDERFLLTGFNEATKQNGFFEQATLNTSHIPHLLTMGPYTYYKISSQLPAPSNSFSQGTRPVKAANAEVWIVSKQNANEYPNYYFTTDWKNFKPLTDLHPQQNFYWLTDELINYKQQDGTHSQGILYKPENFNPQKKYPVIFNYYEHLSYRLNEFPLPEYSANNINIPWFVSHGYLVFTPDSHFSIASRKGGKTVGESVLNSVTGAIIYLSKLKYVDIKQVGIQGHSFGGGETNYLITHSNLFAAACSASGTVSDQISAYLGPYRRKGYEPNFYRIAHSENGHEMIGATLWERPDLYFRSSSVFNANKVTTPLLLMHNETDTQTDWGQSFELFTALTRLGKPVWMLQYDGEGHSLGKKEDQRDFTIRMTQFFDHYLKGAPMPKWMVDGIPARLKAIEQGYELESEKHLLK